MQFFACDSLFLSGLLVYIRRLVFNLLWRRPNHGRKKGILYYFFASVCMATRWYVLQSRWRRRKLWLQSVFLALKLLCFFVGSQIAITQTHRKCCSGVFREGGFCSCLYTAKLYTYRTHCGTTVRWSRKGLLAFREDSLIAQESADLFPRNQASKIKRWRIR